MSFLTLLTSSSYFHAYSHTFTPQRAFIVIPLQDLALGPQRKPAASLRAHLQPSALHPHAAENHWRGSAG